MFANMGLQLRIAVRMCRQDEQAVMHTLSAAPEGRRCSPSKQIHGSRLHFHAEGGAAFSWSALVCSVLFKGFQGSGRATVSSIPKDHYQHQHRALYKHF